MTSASFDRVRLHAESIRKHARDAAVHVGPEGRPELVEAFLRSIEEMDEEPSAANVVRRALSYYLVVLDEIEHADRLDAGYAALASDTERSRIVKRAARKAAKRWADEA